MTSVLLDARSYIAEKRIAAGLSIKAAASIIGISKDSYYDLESYDDEQVTLRVVHILRLCIVLRIPAAELIDKFFESVPPPTELRATFPIDVETVFPNYLERFDTAGREAAGTAEYFESVTKFVEMPIESMVEICIEYGYSPCDFFHEFEGIISIGK